MCLVLRIRWYLVLCIRSMLPLNTVICSELTSTGLMSLQAIRDRFGFTPSPDLTKASWESTDGKDVQSAYQYRVSMSDAARKVHLHFGAGIAMAIDAAAKSNRTEGGRKGLIVM